MKPRVGFLDWGTVDYAEALERQRELFEELVVEVENRRSLRVSERGGVNSTCRSRENDVVQGDATATRAGWIVMCEHPHVYTLGRSGKTENLLVSEAVLRERGATLHRTERGGDITYHGPGQIVGYPILDLERLGLGLREYIAALEQAVIDTAAEFGITAGRISGKTGVWVGGEPGSGDANHFCVSGVADVKLATAGGEERTKTYVTSQPASVMPQARSDHAKICAIGVKASRGVVMHGLALNVTTDLGWFELVNPCGMAGSAVTSMQKETGRETALEEVKSLLRNKLEVHLGIELIPVPRNGE